MRVTFAIRTLATLGCLACGQVTDDTGQGSPVDTDAERLDVVHQMATMLTGEFDSSAQADEMSSYYNVHLWGCAAEAPALDGTALYIEQALTTDQSSPYRQRLYLLAELDPEDEGLPRARSAIYKFTSPGALIGACERQEELTFELDDLELREGCEVDMTWTGSHFEGGTTGQGCTSTNGGDYSVSDIELYEDRIESWDRGYYSSGIQAWGATDGPYIFERVAD